MSILITKLQNVIEDYNFTALKPIYNIHICRLTSIVRKHYLI